MKELYSELLHNGYIRICKDVYDKRAGNVTKVVSIHPWMKNSRERVPGKFILYLNISIHTPLEDQRGTGVHFVGILKKDRVEHHDFLSSDSPIWTIETIPDAIESLKNYGFPWLDNYSNTENLIRFFEKWWMDGIPCEPTVLDQLNGRIPPSRRYAPCFLENLAFLYFHEGNYRKSYEYLRQYLDKVKPAKSEEYILKIKSFLEENLI
jgi:hypothetical protein